MGEARGGIGLGLAEPELSVQYVVAGGAASEIPGFFEVGDVLVGVDGTNVQGMRLREVSALIIGPEDSEVEITIVKALTRQRKVVVLRRRGAGKKQPTYTPQPATEPPPVAPPPKPQHPLPEPIALLPPTFHPPDGHAFPYAPFLTHMFSMECKTRGALIRYTTDASLPAPEPEPLGILYANGGIQLGRVRAPLTVHAIAVLQDSRSASGWRHSKLASATYSFEPSPPPSPHHSSSSSSSHASPPPVFDSIPPVAAAAEPEPEPHECMTPPALLANAMLGKVTDGLSCMSTPTTTTTMSDYTDGGCADTSVSASATDIVADKTQDKFIKRLPSAARSRPGLYASVKSRLNKTTASVRAKDVTNDPQFRRDRPQTPHQLVHCKSAGSSPVTPVRRLTEVNRSIGSLVRSVPRTSDLSLSLSLSRSLARSSSEVLGLARHGSPSLSHACSLPLAAAAHPPPSRPALSQICGVYMDVRAGAGATRISTPPANRISTPMSPLVATAATAAKKKGSAGSESEPAVAAVAAELAAHATRHAMESTPQPLPPQPLPPQHLASTIRQLSTQVPQPLQVRETSVSGHTWLSHSPSLAIRPKQTTNTPPGMLQGTLQGAQLQARHASNPSNASIPSNASNAAAGAGCRPASSKHKQPQNKDPQNHPQHPQHQNHTQHLPHTSALAPETREKDELARFERGIQRTLIEGKLGMQGTLIEGKQGTLIEGTRDMQGTLIEGKPAFGKSSSNKPTARPGVCGGGVAEAPSAQGPDGGGSEEERGGEGGVGGEGGFGGRRGSASGADAEHASSTRSPLASPLRARHGASAGKLPSEALWQTRERLVLQQLGLYDAAATAATDFATDAETYSAATSSATAPSASLSSRMSSSPLVSSPLGLTERQRRLSNGPAAGRELLAAERGAFRTRSTDLPFLLKKKIGRM